MKNATKIYVKKFIDLDKTGAENKISYGLIVDNGKETTVGYNMKREDIVNLTQLEVLRLASQINQTARDIITNAKENEEGIVIRREFMSWAELADDMRIRSLPYKI